MQANVPAGTRDAGAPAQSTPTTAPVPVDAAMPATVPAQSAPTTDSGPLGPASVPLQPADDTLLVKAAHVPDCRASLSIALQAGAPRFIAMRGTQPSAASERTLLVRVDDHGPSEPYDMGPAWLGTSLPSWSPDASFFAFVVPAVDASGNPSSYAGAGITLVDMRTGDAPTAVNVGDSRGGFEWTRHATRYALERDQTAAVVDATGKTPAIEFGLPTGLQRTWWSSDGRYLAITAEKDPAIYVVDTANAKPSAVAFDGGGTQAGSVAWSRRGHRLIFTATTQASPSSSFKLMLLDLEQSPAALTELTQLPDVFPDYDSGPGVWLPGDRVLMRTKNGSLSIANVAAQPPANEAVGMLGSMDALYVTSGGRCAIFPGACGANGEAGACLVSLDLGASRTPTRVLGSDKYALQLSASGSPVLFRSGEQLVVAAFEGGAYEAQLANPGNPFDLFLGGAVSMSPAFWLYYFVQPSGMPGHPYFWSRHSRQTFTFTGDTTGISNAGYWSDDGHFFVSAGNPVTVARFDDDSLLDVWRLQVRVPGHEVEGTQIVWQP